MLRHIVFCVLLAVAAAPSVAAEVPDVCNLFQRSVNSGAAEPPVSQVQWATWQKVALNVAEIQQDVSFDLTQADIDGDGSMEDILRLTAMLRSQLYHEIYVIPHTLLQARRTIKSMSEIADNGRAVKRGSVPLFRDDFGLNAAFMNLLRLDGESFVVLQDDESLQASRIILVATYTGKPDRKYAATWQSDAPSIELEVVCSFARHGPNKPIWTPPQVETDR